MDSPKKRPLHYADLSVVQLKTFADRGDERARQELIQRMTPAAAKRVAPTPGAPATLNTATTHRSRAAPQAAPPPVSPAELPGSIGSHSISDRRALPHTAQSASTAPPMPPAAAMLQAAASASRSASSTSRPAGPDLSQLLLNDAPGATAGTGTLSPELIARLEDIARNAPDDDDHNHPPVYLGGAMLALGLIVALFGFGVTRGTTGTWYFVACGAAMAVSGLLFFKGLKLALPVYALTCALSLIWAVYESPTWLEALLRAAVPLLIAGYAFTGRVRERLG